MSADSAFDTIDIDKGVRCEDCEKFDVGLTYRGVSGTTSEQDVLDAEFPSQCPVCGSELTRYGESE